MYAVIRTGGKQYRVEPGAVIDVDKLALEAGADVEFGEVLLIGDGDTFTVGTPTIAGAKVTGEVVRQFRDEKIIVATYKAKVRQRRRIGHRQPLTSVSIREISQEKAGRKA